MYIAAELFLCIYSYLNYKDISYCRRVSRAAKNSADFLLRDDKYFLAWVAETHKVSKYYDGVSQRCENIYVLPIPANKCWFLRPPPICLCREILLLTRVYEFNIYKRWAKRIVCDVKKLEMILIKIAGKYVYYAQHTFANVSLDLVYESRAGYNQIQNHLTVFIPESSIQIKGEVSNIRYIF